MLEKTLSTLFRISTLAFLLGGLAIVAGQLVGIALGDGHLVTHVEELLAPYAYGGAGVALPHSSRAQSGLGVEVARADLQPGDLVFFYSPISHVGLYIGNGMIVHARTFGKPVSVTSVDQTGYRFGVRLNG